MIKGRIADMNNPELQPESYTTKSVGGVLTDAMLQEVWDNMPHTDLTETVLVAPNRRTAKEWRKMYPGIKIILAVKYTGYPMPKNYPGVSDMLEKDRKAKSKRANAP